MEAGSSQGQQLLNVMAKLKQLHAKTGLNEQIPRGEFQMLHVIWHAMQKQASELEEQHTPPGIKVSELSELLKISPPSVSQMVNLLENKDLVERINTKNDRRVVYIRLTDQGKSVLEDVTKNFLLFTDEIVHRLGTEEADHLIRLIDRLYEIIGDIRAEKENAK